MPDENNPEVSEADSSNNNKYPENSGVQKGIEGDQQNQPTKKQRDNPHRPPKPSLPIRLLHFLWRRRRWKRLRRSDHPSPNWAEKAAMVFTGGILIAAIIQAIIFNRQANLMGVTLDQNERTIILNTGQLVVANRSATAAKSAAETAARAFESSNDSFNKTLLQMKEQTIAQQRAADAAGAEAVVADRQRVSFENSQRAQLLFDDFKPTITNLCCNTNAVTIDGDIVVKNAGPTIAREMHEEDQYGVSRIAPQMTTKFKPIPVPNGPSLDHGQSITYHAQFGLGFWQEVQQGKMFYSFTVVVSYRDIFGDPQVAPVCFMYYYRIKRFDQCFVTVPTLGMPTEEPNKK